MAQRHIITYRCPAVHGSPMPGHIILGDGARVRRGYRVLGAAAVRSGISSLGRTTWRLAVEPMNVAAAQVEIAAGVERWTIVWNKRKRAEQVKR